MHVPGTHAYLQHSESKHSKHAQEELKRKREFIFWFTAPGITSLHLVQTNISKARLLSSGKFRAWTPPHIGTVSCARNFPELRGYSACCVDESFTSKTCHSCACKGDTGTMEPFLLTPDLLKDHEVAKLCQRKKCTVGKKTYGVLQCSFCHRYADRGMMMMMMLMMLLMLLLSLLYCVD